MSFSLYLYLCLLVDASSLITTSDGDSAVVGDDDDMLVQLTSWY